MPPNLEHGRGIFQTRELLRVFLIDDEMQGWDLAFERDADGKLARRVGRGHRTTRILMFHGKKLMEGMRSQLAARENVQLVERTMITDLLVQDQGGRRRVVGATGFHARSGEPVVFEAPAVIMTSGPMAPRTGGGMVDNLSGDGVAMAYQAGVQLLGMEFCLCSNIVTWERRFEVAGINMLQGAGAKLINALGERFMPRYNPELAERSTTQRSWPGQKAVAITTGRNSLTGMMLTG